MLKKVLTVKNIGRFRDYSATGNTELMRLTLVLADNGRGKTTTGDILRSLRSADPAPILGRTTLGATGKPEVSLRFETENIGFTGGAWSKPYPNLCIYDTVFIHENVFAGDCVDHTHKKNLYSVIVGEEGVKLARVVEDFDRKIKDANRDVGDRKSEVERQVPDGVALKTFLALPKNESVEARIGEKEKELSATQNAGQIKAKPVLKSISLPTLPDTFLGVMAKTLEDVTRDVEITVRKHLAEHTNGARESWVGEGMTLIKDGTCPFCQQRLQGSEVIEAYSSFFGKTYGQLKQEIEQQNALVESTFSRRNLLELQKAISANNELISFWREFATLVEPVISFEADVEEPFTKLHAAAEGVGKRKKAAPLETLERDAEFVAGQAAYAAAQVTLSRYNEMVAVVNNLINAKKAATAAADPTKVKSDLVSLKAAMKRHEAGVDSKCVAYQAALLAKDQLEEKKAAAKVALDTHSEKVFDKYQKEINVLLKKFGAGFKLSDAKRSYVGGTPSSTYQIVINGHCVDLGDDSTPASKPSFRNTLSSGDKNTLALAFFLAQIEHDPRRADKIVIFDDPFTSQDRYRRTCTQQLITRLAGIVKQVIVLSHDAAFLKLVWDNAGIVPVKVLQIVRADGDSVTINECDIEAESKAVYLRNYEKMLIFSREGKGDLGDVVKCIRPFLEGWFRLRYPGNFSETEWLGDFIGKIRGADTTSSLHAAKGMLEELSAVNDYSKKYHHEQTPGSITEPLNDTELATFVNRTLALVGN